MKRILCCMHGVTVLFVPRSMVAAQQSSSADSGARKEAAQPVIDPDGAYHFGHGVTAPKLVYSVDAEFSEAARRKKMGGTVVIALTVLPDGQVTKVHVMRSAGEDYTKPKDRKAAATLDEKATEAVRQYRFEPGTYRGKPVPVAITIDVEFHIH